MPRKRPGRVRTKNTNRREALKLSSMAPEDYNVRPGEVKSIACPDCRTWRRIMGDTVLKIREHCISGQVAEGGQHTLCPGTDQVVVIDIDVQRWQARQNRLLRDAMPQENRRAARQFYKPLPAPAAPVARIKAEVTLETARQFYLAHRRGCTRCVGGQHCMDGGALARRYVLALNQEPARREARAEQDRKAWRTERQQSASTVRKAQWARHGGTAIEAANNRCEQRVPGVSEFRGPELPLAPKDVAAHDQRQAELGKQYAARKAAATAA
ncbi:hypothetical protein [Streptomyces clavuligerus]|uniref:hypothetical protein n=1 Tax=Streptomyces clavuligerus TaxID=1901 RepID=UPI00017FF4B8|nr:hypothetical protein [Streptomyces clavuligerus]AXU16814.1 hypothetical protein D1794_29035 [Streptomyces clavuligerus]EDY48777.1 conserved hypothetical protein [Streptomyces clavuligerus]MBY6300948.1 hypothetical protein [Streptomyces clavuligerus]QPJ97039.1 hypothetical protein GE265_28420 [Streptomyces clavuligerus]WDN55759.1 hypothetical protein LL058_28075 [Streptomyces clavuligerus]